MAEDLAQKFDHKYLRHALLNHIQYNLLYLTYTVTPLSQEEADALRVVLLDNGVKPYEVSLEDSQSTLEKVQQLLTGLGHSELATSLRAKISKGKVHMTCIKALDAVHAGIYNRFLHLNQDTYMYIKGTLIKAMP